MAVTQSKRLFDPCRNQIVWRCPKCGEEIHFPNLGALKLSERAGGCQGCLAKATFERKPGMFYIFLDFWMRTNRWPESDSWMEAIPSVSYEVKASTAWKETQNEQSFFL